MKTRISQFLKEREGRIKPKDANALKLSRLDKIDFNGEMHFSLGRTTKTNMISFKKGDLVISGINFSKGAVAVHDGEEECLATIHYSAYHFDPSKIYIPYFKWLIKSEAFKEAVKEQVRGGIKTEIKPKHFLPLEINIHDSLKDQKKIADRIDFAFERTKMFGDLNRKIVKNLSHLKRSIFSEAYSQACKNGQIKKLDELIVEKPRNGYSPKPVSDETKIKTLTLTATTSGVFKKECIKYVDVNLEPISYLWLKDGDILIQRSNSLDYVGVSAVYRGEPHEFIYPDLMMKIHPKEGVIPEFLHIMLMSEKIRNYFRENASGTSGSMPKINQRIVMGVEIPMVSLKDQKMLIERVNTAIEKSQELEGQILSAQNKVESIIQAVLQEAFDFSKQEETVPITQTNKNFWFNLKLGIGAVLEGLRATPYQRGEMVIAKMLYFLQEIYKVPFGLNFVKQNFGPYDSKIKRVIQSDLRKDKAFRAIQVKGKQVYDLGPNSERLLKYSSDILINSQKSMEDLLMRIGKLGSDKIELIASICKVIQDEESIEVEDIYKKLSEWKPNKYTLFDVEDAIKRIKYWDWDKRLCHSI
ncbi:MAG: hypothetical protein H6754_06880 [Candidatus Omnitrophica bacterium]|nr:hypothetical protein [Candidatus Omnitrophota bacterium]